MSPYVASCIAQRRRDILDCLADHAKAGAILQDIAAALGCDAPDFIVAADAWPEMWSAIARGIERAYPFDPDERNWRVNQINVERTAVRNKIEEAAVAHAPLT